FSFIASHNLRGPVASLLGLAHLFDKSKLESEDLKIAELISETTSHLDKVIKDLGSILDVQVHGQKEITEVNFYQLMNDVRTSLAYQTHETQAEINYDFGQASTFRTNRDYLFSILSNLLSNAIKYRSVHRKLKIEVVSFKNRNESGFFVKDNGLGIDL